LRNYKEKETVDSKTWPLAILFLCGIAITWGSAHECFYKTGGELSDSIWFAVIGLIVGPVMTIVGATFILITLVWWLYEKAQRKRD
jgi:hypothetical protein